MSEEQGPDWAKKMVGRTIVKAQKQIDGYSLRFDFADGEPLYLEAEGDCCAHAYVHDVNDPDDLLSTVNRVEENHSSVYDDNNCGVMDAVFYAVHTDEGSVVIDPRVEHNGYYSGRLVEVAAKSVEKVAWVEL